MNLRCFPNTLEFFWNVLWLCEDFEEKMDVQQMLKKDTNGLNLQEPTKNTIGVEKNSLLKPLLAKFK
jgi:hypothetical protein